MIYLDRVLIPGFDQKLSATLTLAGEDLSGTGSNTARAETGDKAKELSVATSIRFIDRADLTALVKLAEAKDDRDERKVWTIVNLMANAMGIKQVRFDGDLTVREDDSLKLWLVNFKLIEYHSVAEKKQQINQAPDKKKKIAVQTQKAVQPIVPVKADPNDPNALAAFDKVLKGAEEKLKN